MGLSRSRRSSRRALSLLAAAAAAGVGAAAMPVLAQAGTRVIAPPGNSGVSQYVEVVPTARGSAPVGGQPPGHSPVLSPAQRRQLESAGTSGKALASFAAHTGVAQPTKASHGGQTAHRSGGAHGTGLAGSGKPGDKAPGGGGGASLPPAVPASSSGAATGGGLGWGLPAALGAVALAAAAAVLARRRPAP